jgi:hypothetical protein
MPIVANSGRRRLKLRGAMEQANKEEVKIPAHSGEATLKPWRMATAVLARMRFGSLEATAQANLTYPWGRPIGRLQRL